MEILGSGYVQAQKCGRAKPDMGFKVFKPFPLHIYIYSSQAVFCKLEAHLSLNH